MSFSPGASELTYASCASTLPPRSISSSGTKCAWCFACSLSPHARQTRRDAWPHSGCAHRYSTDWFLCFAFTQFTIQREGGGYCVDLEGFVGVLVPEGRLWRGVPFLSECVCMRV